MDSPEAGQQRTPQRILYRLYRRLKVHFLAAPPSLLRRAFFAALGVMNHVMSPRSRLTPAQRQSDAAYRVEYEKKFGPAPLFELRTARPVAVDSDDHRHPRGSVFDNSVNRRFNAAAYRMLGGKPDFSLLDLGCAGGGLVRSVLDDGYTAVGIEGSNASRRVGTGEWPNCPLHLFTADLTAPFELLDRSGAPVSFDVITAWEVLEHIPADRLAEVFGNIRRHLAPGGIFVGSVDMLPDGDPQTGAVYHVTLKPREWWIERFAEAGLVELPAHPFVIEDYVRGNGLSLRDWDPRDGDGFHVVLRTAPG